jgi:hypothetical protein
MTAQMRKNQSIEVLKKYNIPYIEQLPVIETEEEVNERSLQEIAKRAIACLLAIQFACDLSKGDPSIIEQSREFIMNFARKFGVENEFTDEEASFFLGKPEQQKIINMAWKYEAYWVLLWALGLIEQLEYPSDTCDCKIAIQAVSKRKDFDDFIKHTKPRSISAILDEADLIYRYHWACVDARINGRDTPANLDSSVVYERHWGLNWLIGKGIDCYDNWDCVATDT